MTEEIKQLALKELEEEQIRELIEGEKEKLRHERKVNKSFWNKLFPYTLVRKDCIDTKHAMFIQEVKDVCKKYDINYEYNIKACVYGLLIKYEFVKKEKTC